MPPRRIFALPCAYAYAVLSWKFLSAEAFPLTSKSHFNSGFRMTTSSTGSGGAGAEAMEVRRHVSPFPPSNKDESDKVPSCLIILNGPIDRPPSRIFRHLWDCSAYRICADGGANRLFDATAASVCEEKEDSSKSRRSDDNVYIPNKIKGDLDSLRSDVREHYEKLGVDVERDRCQDTNDLDKCLQTILAKFGGADNSSSNNSGSCEASNGNGKESKTDVYIYGAFGGRFDQEMASIQALYRWADDFSYRLVLYSDETCAFLLPSGVINEVKLANIAETDGKEGDEDDRPMGEGVTCGLVPIGCRCDSVTTTGLKWNLDGDMPLEFGGLVSTSNRIVEGVVTVQSSQPLVFTTEMIS